MEEGPAKASPVNLTEVSEHHGDPLAAPIVGLEEKIVLFEAFIEIVCRALAQMGLEELQTFGACRDIQSLAG